MKKLLVIGYGSPGYGFGRVLHSLLIGFRAHFTLWQLELSSARPAVDWPVLQYASRDAAVRQQELRAFLRHLQPDGVLLLVDGWETVQYADWLARVDSSIPVVAYCPVDGPILRPEGLAPLAHLRELIVFTHFARQQMERAFACLSQQNTLFHPPPVGVIPHGLEPELFYPLVAGDPSASRQRARQLLFGDNSALADGFLVLNANRNQMRKRLDVTLEGFARFAAGKAANVRLYLHTGVRDEGINILGLAKRLGITDRLLLTRYDWGHPVVDSQHLNLIYNACDVGLNTSGGEGWGLVSFEHAATGAAQVVPRHSACEELWTGKALLMEPEKPTAYPVLNLSLQYVNAGEVARALECLYTNERLRTELGQKASEQVHQPGYQWPWIADRFVETLSERMRDHSR